MGDGIPVCECAEACWHAGNTRIFRVFQVCGNMLGTLARWANSQCASVRLPCKGSTLAHWDSRADSSED